MNIHPLFCTAAKYGRRSICRLIGADAYFQNVSELSVFSDSPQRYLNPRICIIPDEGKKLTNDKLHNTLRALGYHMVHCRINRLNTLPDVIEYVIPEVSGCKINAVIPFWRRFPADNFERTETGQFFQRG